MCLVLSRYFIPVRMRVSRDSDVLMQAVQYIRETWPWWNETNGANHFLFHLGEQSRTSDRPCLTGWGIWPASQFGDYRHNQTQQHTCK